MVDPEFIVERCTDAVIINEKYARELDADWFATTPIAMHIIENTDSNTE